MISDSFFNESLCLLRKNGAIFFEIFFEETDISYSDVTNGQISPDKSVTTRGVSLRAFDGKKDICVSTKDLSYTNLRMMVQALASRMSTSNNKQPLRCNTLNDYGTAIISRGKAWTPLRDTINKEISERQNKSADYSDRDIQFKSRCFFHTRNVQLLSSYNGAVYDNRSICCIQEDIWGNGIQTTNVFMPSSYDEFRKINQTGSMVCGNHSVGQDAVDCPTGRFDIVLVSGSSSLFIHECCGHPLEIYNAAHPEGIFHDCIGKKIASDCVTLCDDGSLKDLYGSFSVDDEGNPAQNNILIRNGVLEGYLVDLVEGYKYNINTTSTTRRQGYKYAPTARMTNTYLAKGTCTEEDIIKETRAGMLIHSFSFGSINPITGDFTVNITSGRIIRNGILQESFRGGRICANALEVLSNIDMVADNLTFKNGFCFAPSGRIAVSGGQPTIRISDVPVFGSR